MIVTPDARSKPVRSTAPLKVDAAVDELIADGTHFLNMTKKDLVAAAVGICLEARRDEIRVAMLEKLRKLDGSVAASVSLLTGLSHSRSRISAGSARAAARRRPTPRMTLDPRSPRRCRTGLACVPGSANWRPRTPGCSNCWSSARVKLAHRTGGPRNPLPTNHHTEPVSMDTGSRSGATGGPDGSLLETDKLGRTAE